MLGIPHLTVECGEHPTPVETNLLPSIIPLDIWYRTIVTISADHDVVRRLVDVHMVHPFSHLAFGHIQDLAWIVALHGKDCPLEPYCSLLN